MQLYVLYSSFAFILCKSSLSTFEDAMKNFTTEDKCDTMVSTDKLRGKLWDIFQINASEELYGIVTFIYYCYSLLMKWP